MMTMEKKGVIDDNTPGCRCDCNCKKGEPTTKEAADKLEQHTMTDAVDTVADRTKQNR